MERAPWIAGLGAVLVGFVVATALRAREPAVAPETVERAAATGGAAGPTWWCVCYSHRLAGGATEAVTSCRATRSKCEALQADANAGARQFVRGSVTATCTTVVGEFPWLRFGSQAQWRATAGYKPAGGAYASNGQCWLTR